MTQIQKKFSPTIDLSEFKGIAIEMRSDQKLDFEFGFKTGKKTWDSTFYENQFPMYRNLWRRVEIPFSNFRCADTGKNME